jgi:8-oxo-dGTP pyrophosphatase MutT (NUDIX family)
MAPPLSAPSLERVDGARDAVVRAVTAFRPVTAREQRSRDRFLVELDRLVDPFDRDRDRVHCTASAIVLSPSGVLLHRHKRLGVWLQPGGHVDPGESAAEGALREVEEETGVPVAHPGVSPFLVHLDVHPSSGHVHLDLRYLLMAEAVAPDPPSGESQEVRWYRLDEAIGIVDEGLVDACYRIVHLLGPNARSGAPVPSGR